MLAVIRMSEMKHPIYTFLDSPTKTIRPILVDGFKHE
jgi:hypothetical protein